MLRALPFLTGLLTLLLSGCAFFQPFGVETSDPDALASGSGCRSEGLQELTPAPPRDFTGQVTSGGLARTYRVHLPPGYRASVPAPLVLSFHGYASSSASQERLTALTRLADREGFIVVAPEGLNAWRMRRFSLAPWLESWNAGSCCGDAQKYQVDDVAFVHTLLAQLRASLCVDGQRQFATGMSNGGFLVHRLACQLSDEIAAVGAVASVNLTRPCEPARAVPVLQINGTEDPIVPFGGSVWFPPATGSVESWALRNGCSDATTTTFSQGDTTCTAHTDCVTVEQCIVRGGGHTWPGGTAPALFGKTTHDFDADAWIWRFFQAHPLQPPAGPVSAPDADRPPALLSPR